MERTAQETMDVTVEENMDGVVTPQAPTGAWNRLLSVWHSKPVQIQLLRIALILYMTGLVMDIVLAVRYYYGGNFHWFGWTLGFMFAPSIVMSVRSGLGIETVENNVSRCDRFLFNILQLAMPLRYFDILQMLSSDNRRVDDSRMLRLCHAHLVIAMLKGMPQLILKIYIIGSSQEQVTVLEVISMVISLLIAVKAAVTFMYYDRGRDSDRQSNHQFVIILTIWKIVELSVRALIIGLCLSLSVIPIPIVVIVLHWLVMVCSPEFTIEDYKDAIECALYLAIGTFSTTFYWEEKGRIVLNTLLTFMGNMLMVIGCVLLVRDFRLQLEYNFLALMITLIGTPICLLLPIAAADLGNKLQ